MAQSRVTRATHVKIAFLVSFIGAVAGCMSTENAVTRQLVTPDSYASNGLSDITYASGGGGTIEAYVTGYSFWDNTPPGSAQIARPVVHRRAGGTGTYHDPVTVAVGHVKNGGRSLMDYPAGTRFYFPRLKKYGIAEDLCGDGPHPQNGPCHVGYQGHPWLDIYVGGRSVGSSAADRCMNAITGIQTVIMAPSPTLPVDRGEIALSSCRRT